MKIKKIAVLVGMGLAFSGGVHAANIWVTATPPTTDVGTLVANNTYTGTVNVIGNFSHKWLFDITTPIFSGGSVSNVPINFSFNNQSFNLADITGLSAKLYNSSAVLILDLDSNVGSNANVKVGSGIFPIANDYYFLVSGTGSGTGSGTNNNGVYSFSLTTLPVPEAETWAMMLAGLGLVGMQLRRKSKAAKQISVN